ncbi:MAG: glutathionylspermidine synthase family protein [Polyangiaceae bacterium]
MSYDEFAKRILEEGLITDPWLDGEPRFDSKPIVVDSDDARELASIGERICALYNDAFLILDEQESLATSFFGLTETQLAMWKNSRTLWHGIARADVFRTKDGWAVAELNSDTPTGSAEAITLGNICERTAKQRNPNGALESRIANAFEHFAKMLLGENIDKRVGIVYPTEFTEDLSLIRLYKRIFEARGYAVSLGSPYNLREQDGQLFLFDEPVSILLRHYKTDWWSERSSSWLDDPVVDTAPLLEPLEHVFRACAAGKLAVVNPFGSVLTQNKRMMAFFWEHIHRFSEKAQETIKAFIPVTFRMESLHVELLKAKKAEWVLKSAYGAEGDQVVIGALTDDATWNESLEKARPGLWVAQRYFDAELDENGMNVNLGVYVIGGKAAGLFARKQKGPTDGSALSVPVLIG